MYFFSRTGKTCTLTVKTEGEPDAVVEGFLPGTFSVFNLNQKLSKFFIGGVSDNTQVSPKKLLSSQLQKVNKKKSFRFKI